MLSLTAHRLGQAKYSYETTIPERAREMALIRAGRILTSIQLDCVAMLRSRMHESTVEEDAFNAAWAKAWELREDDGRPFDRALEVK